MHGEAHLVGGGMSASQKRLSALDDYVSGLMPESEAEDFEQALFADAASGEVADATFFDDVARLTRFIGRHGVIGSSFTRTQIDALAKDVRMFVFELSPDTAHRLEPIPEDVDIVVTHLNVDLRGFDSVDVEVERPDGSHVKTFHDVGCDPSDGSIFAWCEAPLARLALFSGPSVTRVFGTQSGERKEVASYTVTPSV
jgi:hypothetical protein